MVDSLPVSRSSGTSAARDSFRMARDAATRASVTPSSDSLLQAGLERLRRFLDSGESLKHDVPRGYYLNITV